jgi:tRNA-2-methylthio-N6-dimethylallyladenosine synthase
MAERLADELLEKKVVDLVAGPDAYRDLPFLIDKVNEGEAAINVELTIDETYDSLVQKRLEAGSISGFVSITRGCNNFCTYCIVPYTRGRERSRSSSSVLAETRRIVDQGYTEIQLLGQNVNSYQDPEGKCSFAELLAAVGQVNGIHRVRFMTSHPRDFTRDIVDVIDQVPTLCDHVHLPVQSGSERILKLMNRGYTPEWYMERIGWIKAARRPLALSTDIIVGFPGETPDDFAQTMDLLDRVEYDCVYGFKYSARPNTPALTMHDSIPDEEKSTRLQVLLDHQREIQRINYARHLGQVIEVMVEGMNPARGQVIGRSSQNIPVNFTCAQPIAPAPGSYLQVRITATHPNSLFGESV